MRVGSALRKVRHAVRSNMLVRMILSYLVVILVSVIVYASMYSYAFDNMRSYILSSGTSAQQAAADQIENLLSGTDAALYQMSGDIQFQRFHNVKPPITSEDYMSLYTIKGKLQNYKNLNPSIYNLLIYFRKSDCVCSNRTASARLPLAYSTEYGCEGVSLQDWLDGVDKSGSFGFQRAGRLINGKADVLTYVHRFPYNYIGRNASVAVVQFETSTLGGILSSGLLEQSARSVLIDSRGQTIFALGGMEGGDAELAQIREGCAETKIGGRNCIVFRTELSSYGLSCVTAFDVNTLMAETTHHRMVLLGVLLGALVLELVYVFLVSRRSYRPIQEVLSILPEKPGEGESELKSIHASITRMNRESEEIRRRLDDNQEALRKLCLSKLLGLEPGFDRLDQALSDLPSDCAAHFVFIVYTPSRNTPDNGISLGQSCVSALEQRLRQERAADSVISFDYFTHSTAFILSTVSAEAVNESISRLTKLLFDVDFELSAGIGLPALALNGISRSFSEARLAVQEARTNNDRVVLYEDTPSRQSAYDYSGDVEAALEASIIAGNGDKALEIINGVYWKTRESYSAPAKLQLLLSEIYGTLLKIRQYNPLNSPAAEREFYFLLNAIEFNTNLFQRYNSILQAVRYYCDKAAENKNSLLPSLCQRVCEYIAEHYADPDLCLDQIANEFEVSTKYLSRHFKEQTGSNISAYITNMRMKQAGYLLQSREIGVAELAALCGYASENTFYKAFKRYWGMSPGSFRSANPAARPGNAGDIRDESNNQEIEETDDE